MKKDYSYQIEDLFEDLKLCEYSTKEISTTKYEHHAYFRHIKLPLIFGQSETGYEQDDTIRQIKAIEEAKENVIMFVRFENNMGLQPGLLPYWDKEKKKWFIKNEGKKIYE